MGFAGVFLLACSAAFGYFAWDHGFPGGIFAGFWAAVCLGFGADAIAFELSLKHLRRQALRQATLNHQHWGCKSHQSSSPAPA
jgi:hypothetical protein